MRLFLGLCLLAIGGALAMVAYGSLENLWNGAADKTADAYLLIGIPALAAALLFAWLGIRVGTHDPGQPPGE